MLFDPIRGYGVAATPEEQIRQTLILQLIGPLGFPKSLIGVEKELSTISTKNLPSALNRRIDLICYCPVEGGLKPLLLIECKAGPFPLGAENQLFGYNVWIEAPFIALANNLGAKLFWKESHVWNFVPFIPSYEQLKMQSGFYAARS